MKKNYTITFTFEDENGIIYPKATEIIAAKNEKKAKEKLEKTYNDCDITEIHNIKKEPTIGLIVIRAQGFHNGHVALANMAFRECDIVIIAMGSTQESRTINNPWSPKERRTMWEMVFGKSGKHSKLKIVELRDIGSVSKIAWASHVFGKIEGLNLPKPTHYYAGSKHDASWFDSMNEEFGKDTLQIRILDRLTKSICMSGTEIRKSILDNSNEWKKYVPPVLVEYMESTFPQELKLYTDIDPVKAKQLFEDRLIK